VPFYLLVGFTGAYGRLLAAVLPLNAIGLGFGLLFGCFAETAQGAQARGGAPRARAMAVTRRREASGSLWQLPRRCEAAGS
jgi:hypothetical protein